MKRLLQLALAIAVMGAAAGCEGPRGPKGDPGRDGFVDFAEETIKVRGNANPNLSHWEKMADAGTGYNAYYVSSWDVPWLNRYITEEGVVMAYLVGKNSATGNNTYDPLPYTLWYDDGFDIYEITLNYKYEYGGISFFYTTSDFGYPDDGPGDYDFRVVGMW